MLTIPDELLEAARMDAASEWRIFWRIVMPLSLPALSVLAILSVIWRWNDFLWPLIVLVSDPRQHTLQLGLTQFAGEFNTDFHYILAMTVVSLIPITLVFVWLQRFITTGIATTGLK
jgi:alpha-1,4-digalacturonate transport system permease protein